MVIYMLVDMDKYRGIPLFRGIPEHRICPLLQAVVTHGREYKKGETLIAAGETAGAIGVILSGSVHMLKYDVWGRKTLIAYMSRGDLFGESFAVRQEKSSYTFFEAAADTEVVFIRFEQIVHDCCGDEEHHRLLRNLFECMGKKKFQLMEKIEIMSRPTLREKIMSYISMIAQHQKSRYIHLPLSRTEMAEFIGANRSAMTRELTRMKEEQIIDFDGNVFIIR